MARSLVPALLTIVKQFRTTPPKNILSSLTKLCTANLDKFCTSEFADQERAMKCVADIILLWSLHSISISVDPLPCEDILRCCQYLYSLREFCRKVTCLVRKKRKTTSGSNSFDEVLLYFRQQELLTMHLLRQQLQAPLCSVLGRSAPQVAMMY